MARGDGPKSGRGRQRGDGALPRDVIVSKKLSWLLRHGAEQEGLKLGKGGYAGLKEVLENRKIRSLKVTLPEICQIVADNEKQRFSLIHISAAPDSNGSTTVPTSNALQDDADTDVSHYLIRANQGHSLAVSSEDLLTPITLEANNLPSMVVHGTRRDLWRPILTSGGLKSMTRNHVHFAIDLPNSFKEAQDRPPESDEKVEQLPDSKEETTAVSGMRTSSSVLIFIDLKKALEGGLKFWMSQNGVVLSEGNEKGLVPVEYFQRVQERSNFTTTMQVLMENGKELKGVPAAGG